MRCKIAPGKRVYWQGRDRLEGEIIDMPDKEARINIKLNRVTDAEGERPLRVADPRPAADPSSAPKPRTYRRRDMTPEND